MKHPIQRIVAICLTTAFFLPALGCGEEGPAESAGRAIDEAVENANENVDEAIEDAKKELEESKKEG